MKAGEKEAERRAEEAGEEEGREVEVEAEVVGTTRLLRSLSDFAGVASSAGVADEVAL